MCGRKAKTGKIRLHKYPDTCGRRLNILSLNFLFILATLKNCFGKCSLFVLSKIKTWPLRFSVKENPNMEKALFGWPIVLQYDFRAKYRSISKKFPGMKFFHPGVRLTNQKRKTKVDQFLVIFDNTRVFKSKPNIFFRLGSVSILSMESQTYTYKLQLGDAFKSGVITVYILKVNTCAKKLYTVTALASPLVGRSFDSRTGGRGFDSRGRTNTQGLKITEKRRYSLCAASGQSFVWLG